jgi:phosphoadenosine phosphosulfate reductase
MHITMIKKRLADGQPCKKCGQADEVLERRGLLDRIDEVVWAEERDADSPGMVLSRRFQVDVAPFFVVKQGEAAPAVHTSVVQFAKWLDSLQPRNTTTFSVSDHNQVLTTEELSRVGAELDQALPQEILRWGLDRFGERCALAFSGAEDVVLIDMAVKLGYNSRVFCLDTGRLHAETYQFIEKVRQHYGVEVELLSPAAEQLEPFVRRKGLFSFYQDGHQECCSVRKVAPLRRALETCGAWITGQRKDQSVTRVELAVVHQDLAQGAHRSPSNPLIKLNPLANWSSAQVWAYIRDHEVPYNSLHERGFVSIGCEPCTRPTKPTEHERAGRWWWEAATQRECGLHASK